MSTLGSKSNKAEGAILRLAKSQGTKMRLTAFLQSFFEGMPLVGLRHKFPESWKWILLSRQIQGWLSEAEADQLFKLAKYHTPDRNPVVVELGSWKGKSSVMLAGGQIRKECPRLFCIDPFGAGDESSEYQAKYYLPLAKEDERPVELIFEQNMKACGVRHIVVPLKGYSFQFSKTWSERIDLLFIDANHEYDAVLRDFLTWSGFVKKGGIVAFHDANGVWPGPTRVVAEVLKSPDYGPVQTVDSLAWAIRKTATS